MCDGYAIQVNVIAIYLFIANYFLKANLCKILILSDVVSLIQSRSSSSLANLQCLSVIKPHWDKSGVLDK